MHMYVDEPGRYHAPRGLHDLVGLRLCLRDGGDFSVLHQNVKNALHPVRRVEDEAASDQSPHFWCSFHLFALFHDFFHALTLLPPVPATNILYAKIQIFKLNYKIIFAKIASFSVFCVIPVQSPMSCERQR